jgi:hypothetical protein
LTKSKFSGSILNSHSRYLFGTGNSSDHSQKFYIEENTNSLASKNSQEMLFYHYFNPIYEDDESGLEENYNRADPSQNQYMDQGQTFCEGGNQRILTNRVM